MQYTHSILLISNDNYIIGLIKGYSIANNIGFNQLSSDKVLQLEDFSSTIQIIIFDTHKLNLPLLRSNLKLLRQINHLFKTPICAIATNKDDKLIYTETWIDDIFNEPIIDHLHYYFQTNFGKDCSQHSNRRNTNRRMQQDRRIEITNSLPSTQILLPLLPLKTDIQYDIGPFDIDSNSKTVSLMDKDLRLTSKEFKLFCFLATDIEHVFSAEEIIQHLWPQEYRANKSDLYQYMHLLRKKVESNPDKPIWILTIKGAGYRLNIQSHFTS